MFLQGTNIKTSYSIVCGIASKKKEWRYLHGEILLKLDWYSGQKITFTAVPLTMQALRVYWTM
jgi:hypothetical protein